MEDYCKDIELDLGSIYLNRWYGNLQGVKHQVCREIRLYVGHVYLLPSVVTIGAENGVNVGIVRPFIACLA